MQTNNKTFLVVLISIFLSSCSLVDKVALKRFSAIMDKASIQMEKEASFDEIETTFLSNIKLLEALWSVEPTNKNFLRSLVKGYGSYAFGVDETYLLSDKLKENDNKHFQNKANEHYTKAINYGLRYLATAGINYDDLLVATKKGEVQMLLDDKLSSDISDLEAVFFTTQSLAGLINLNKTNMKLMGQMGTMKAMMDWVCSKKPDLHMGACDMFFATYEASLPVMMGGKPAKAKKLYEEGLKKYPNNLLLRVSYVQFYILPRMDEDLYNEQKPLIKKQMRKFEKKKYFWPNLREDNSDRLKAFNAIAGKRFSIIEKFENDIF